MKLDLEMAIPQPVPTADDPFALGWRYPKDGDADMIPLTEDDLVYPEEGDFVVNNLAHNNNREYLMAVFKARVAGRPGLRVLGDHLIDFQVPAIKKNLGPDVILLNGEAKEWNPGKGVFPVKRMKARPLIAIEITSPTTRRKDLTVKPGLYFKAGVPLFVLIDLEYGGGKNPSGITAFQAGPTDYEALPPDEDGRVWLEVVEVFLAVENGGVVCYDQSGKRLEDYTGLMKQNAKAEAEATTEKKKARRAEKRADAATAARDAEQIARLAAEEKLKELEAELRRLRGDTN